MLSVTALTALALAGFVSAAGKRGVSWPYYNELNADLKAAVFGSGTGEVVYIYNWETYKPAHPGSLNFIGTQATLDSSSSPVADLASRAKTQGWTDVFSLNEPDLNGITPAQAVSFYLEYINPLAIHKGYPAVSSSTNSGEGLSWLKTFITQCTAQGCYHDYINLHWYGSTLAEFKTYITNAHTEFPGEQMVISEFALTSPATAAEQKTFFSSAFTFLDGLSYVVMYFPFVSTSPAMMTEYDSGSVSTVGTGCTTLQNSGALSAIGTLMVG